MHALSVICWKQFFLWHAACSGVTAGAEGTIPPPTFWAVGKLLENVLVVRKFLSKNARFGVENL